jgi:hypothetical protein
LIATTAVWGLNSNGAPYFNAEGVAEMDGARMIIIAGISYLVIP